VFDKVAVWVYRTDPSVSRPLAAFVAEDAGFLSPESG